VALAALRRFERGAIAALLLAAAPAASAQDATHTRAQEIIAGSCFVCHGAQGESAGAGFPRLAGQHGAYVAQQLADFKSGRRKSTTMQPLVEELSAADFTALGRFFETRTPGAYPVENPELAGLGREVYLKGRPDAGVPPCATCHGQTGHGTAVLLRLAGQHVLYTENQLQQFARGARPATVMGSIAKGLSAQEMKAVAAYISSLK
jgi:cytochrome c553